jgi:hypothetical protein
MCRPGATLTLACTPQREHCGWGRLGTRDGIRSFAKTRRSEFDLGCTRAVDFPGITHLRYRALNRNGRRLSSSALRAPPPHNPPREPGANRFAKQREHESTSVSHLRNGRAASVLRGTQ